MKPRMRRVTIADDLYSWECKLLRDGLTYIGRGPTPDTAWRSYLSALRLRSAAHQRNAEFREVISPVMVRRNG